MDDGTKLLIGRKQREEQKRCVNKHIFICFYLNALNNKILYTKIIKTMGVVYLQNENTKQNRN